MIYRHLWNLEVEETWSKIQALVRTDGTNRIGSSFHELEYRLEGKIEGKPKLESWEKKERESLYLSMSV